MKKVMLSSLLLLFLFFFASACLAQEELTIVTYYPAPYGVYKQLELLEQSGQPAIDFSNDSSASGYDMQIKLDGDNLLAIRGGDVRIYGKIYAENLPECRRYTFTSTSGVQDCPEEYSIPVAPVKPDGTSGVFLCCRYN